MNLCLNPCFSGRWYARTSEKSMITITRTVLILVLVEDGLRGHTAGMSLKLIFTSLNPCFSGRWSARGKSVTRRYADL